MELGAISAKYESNGKPGTISKGKGDKGGKSYGMYQFSLDTGALNAYVVKSRYKAEFAGIVLGSEAFDAVWRAIAEREPEAFKDDQHEYIKRVYYTPVRKLADTLHIPNTEAVNQMIWSASVQHGPNWISAVLKAVSGLKERELITSVYAKRTSQFQNSTYYNSSAARRQVRDSVLNRFKQELKLVLNLIQ